MYGFGQESKLYMPVASPDIQISTPEDIKAPKKVEVKVQPKPIGPTEATIAKEIDAKAPNPDAEFQEILDTPTAVEDRPIESTKSSDVKVTPEAQPETGKNTESASLRVDLSSESRQKIKALRDKDRVGVDAYGKDGLVNAYHKKGMSVAEHETAQQEAYGGLDAKIEAGIIDPTAIMSEVCVKLNVSPELKVIPQTFEDIVPLVNVEVQKFLEQGNLNQQEFESIQSEVVEFTNLYAAAYGKENIRGVYELVRDNARKLSYQSAVDKDVFSGSDHGTRHILDGDMRFARQMIESLRANGVNVSSQDEVLIHQTLIDHDIGYTTGAAQAPRSWGASKDHPLVSARFIEDNKAYYVDKFSEDGYQSIHNSVLNHSYPRLEYQSDETNGVHKDLIRGITSTVDTLGVTVETKTPEFFWNKDAMRTLLRIRLAMETHGQKVPPEMMARCRQELIDIAGQEPNPDRAAGYKNAVDNFFNEQTADNTLGQYTGVVRNVRVEQADADDAQGEVGDESKSVRVVVDISPSEVYAVLGNMFGSKLSNQAFVKVMEDLGLDQSELQKQGRSIAQSRGHKGESVPGIVTENKHAKVNIEGTFIEDMPTEQGNTILGEVRIQEIAQVFQEAEALSIRTEINQLLEGDASVFPELVGEFLDGITAKTTEAEAIGLNELLISISDLSPSGEKDENGSDITVSQKARNALRGFLTQKEKEFLGI